MTVRLRAKYARGSTLERIIEQCVDEAEVMQQLELKNTSSV